MRNEARRIGGCLDSIADSTYPMKDCEVLVVDGGSTDCSCAIAASKLMNFPSARLLHNSKKNVPAGLNSAIKIARGRFIIRMDAHCEYQKNYIETCLEELERTGAANVGGLLLTLPGRDTWVSRCIALISQHPVGVGNSAFRLGMGNQFVDTVPFGAFRREVFDVVGLYREELPRNQDFELNSRIRSAGYNIYLSSKLSTKYYNSEGLRNFFRQAILNGQGAARCWMINPNSFCFRHAAPLLFVVGWLFLLVFSAFYHHAGIVFIAYNLFYIVAVIYATIEIAIHNNWRYILFVPVLLVVYHMSYGVSTGIGGLKLFNAWAISHCAGIRK
jgi:glycosyltransferase involved in cell wall biosynthesis